MKQMKLNVFLQAQPNELVPNYVTNSAISSRSDFINILYCSTSTKGWQRTSRVSSQDSCAAVQEAEEGPGLLLWPLFGVEPYA